MDPFLYACERELSWTQPLRTSVLMICEGLRIHDSRVIMIMIMIMIIMIIMSIMMIMIIYSILAPLPEIHREGLIRS